MRAVGDRGRYRESAESRSISKTDKEEGGRSKVRSGLLAVRSIRYSSLD